MLLRRATSVARTAAALVVCLAATACAGGGDGSGQVGTALNETTVRFVATDGSLDDATIGAVGKRLRSAGLGPLVQHDDVGMTLGVEDVATPAALARLAASDGSFAIRPSLVERPASCAAPAPPEAAVVLPDLRPVLPTCWPAGEALVTRADLTEVEVSDQQANTLVIALSPEAAARFDRTAPTLLGRRLVVSVGRWVVAVAPLNDTEFGGRLSISLDDRDEAALVRSVLTSPPLPDTLVEPDEVGPSGFGPSGGAE